MPKRLMAHQIKHWMLRDRITIVVVGCGGTGAALISGLPYLHHALLAAGHPSGIKACVIVATASRKRTACVSRFRSAFSRFDENWPKILYFRRLA
jgi:hypothetical protein